MRIKGNVLTESGVVKATARKTMAAYVANHRNIFASAVANDNGTYSVAVKDEAGNTVYINFEVTVSAMNAADRAKRKAKAKAKATEEFEVE